MVLGLEYICSSVGNFPCFPSSASEYSFRKLPKEIVGSCSVFGMFMTLRKWVGELKAEMLWDNSCLMSLLVCTREENGPDCSQSEAWKCIFLDLCICISNCYVIKTKWTVATSNFKMKGNHPSGEEGDPLTCKLAWILAL